MLTKEDGTLETYTGFNYAVEITDKENVYAVELHCQSEAEYQLAILTKRYNEALTTIASLQADLLDTQLALAELYESTLTE